MIHTMEGYTWRPHAKLVPMLLSAMEVVHVDGRSRTRNQNAMWALDYCFASGMRVRVGSPASRWQTRQAGVAHLYAPQTAYWEEIPLAKPFREAYVVFRGAEAAGLGRLLRGRRYVRIVDGEGRIGELLHQAAMIGKVDGESGYWSAQAVLCRLIALLHGAVAVDPETLSVSLPAARPATDFAREADAILRRNLRQGLSLADLAAALHVSESTLLRRFRDELGRSPIAHFIRLRISMAKGMLLKGHRLKTVAAHVGFSDAYHLSKTFKKVEGLSPRDFTRLQR